MVVPQGNMVAPLGNLIPSSWKQLVFRNYIHTISSSISFVDEKENSEKSLNLEPLGYRGILITALVSFPLKEFLKKIQALIIVCAGTLKRNLIFFSYWHYIILYYNCIQLDVAFNLFLLFNVCLIEAYFWSMCGFALFCTIWLPSRQKMNLFSWNTLVRLDIILVMVS